jgi:hypothetical protein
MTATAITMLVVSLVLVPGGLIASVIFLVRKPEVGTYPPLGPSSAD